MLTKIKVASYDGSKLKNESWEVCDYDTQHKLQLENSHWQAGAHCSRAQGSRYVENQISAVFRLEKGSLKNGCTSVVLEFENWNKDNYVFAPAAVYNGNRYRVVRKAYPPMLHEEDGIGAAMKTTITDVPRLEQEGDGQIQLLSGDMATPGFGIHFKDREQGLLIYTTHQANKRYTGFIFREEGKKASLEIQVPGVRSKMYRMTDAEAPSDDRGANFEEGTSVELTLKVYSFPCKDICALYKAFWETRKCMNEEIRIENTLPFSKAFDIIEQKFMNTQWNEPYGYFMIAPQGMGLYGDWQAGWVGGGMNSLAFLADGTADAAARAEKTLTTIFGVLQKPNGYIVPILYQGRQLGDDYCHQEKSEILLLRKNADVLTYAVRHILAQRERRQEVSALWLAGTKKLADALVRLWEKYGQLGQFIDINKEEILMGGTASAGIAVAGLALCFRLFGSQKYLAAARSAAEYYHTEYLCKGLLNGGPGEILQCPDSEAAFGLLEGFVVLYEVTGEKKWLDYGEKCAHQCASWCVSYDFEFPTQSEFGRLGMKTTGSVFANVQNKHSAPGICTLSPLSLLKLYKYTGDSKFLELCFEIAHNVVQYLSREDRPIMSWDGELLPAGWMSERVNMSDWEGKQNIGEVFKGSCWCEISAMMTYVDIPGIWFLSSTGRAVVFDHVSVQVEEQKDKWILHVQNDTKFDARVKLLVDGDKEIWGEAALINCRIIKAPANSTQTVEIGKLC